MTERSDIEKIRLRPGMYTGLSKEGQGVYQLIFEAVAHSIVASWPNVCSRIEVTLCKSGSVIVTDDGPGIEVDLNDPMHTQLERSLTKLIAFQQTDQLVSLMDLRASDSLVIINALSERCEVETVCQSKRYYIRYENGVCTAPLSRIEASNRGHGTRVEFVPDKRVFPLDDIECAVLEKRFSELTNLETGTLLVLHDARGREQAEISIPF